MTSTELDRFLMNSGTDYKTCTATLEKCKALIEMAPVNPLEAYHQMYEDICTMEYLLTALQNDRAGRLSDPDRYKRYALASLDSIRTAFKLDLTVYEDVDGLEVRDTDGGALMFGESWLEVMEYLDGYGDGMQRGKEREYNAWMKALKQIQEERPND